MSDNDRPAWAYAAENLPAARAAGIDPIDPDALGPCGCVDYHLADCPLRTGGSDGSDAWAWAERRARLDDDGAWDQ